MPVSHGLTNGRAAPLCAILSAAAPFARVVLPIVSALGTDMLDMRVHLALLQPVYEFALTLGIICVLAHVSQVGLCILVGVSGELAKDTDDLLVAEVGVHVFIIPKPCTRVKNIPPENSTLLGPIDAAVCALYPKDPPSLFWDS